MKSHLRTCGLVQGGFGSLGARLVAAVFCILGPGLAARAQEVIAPPPISSPSANPPLYSWGPVSLRPHLFYRFLYGDGVPVKPGQSFTTGISEVKPGMLLNLGTHWTLDYTPTERLYSNKNFKDGLDEDVELSGQTTNSAWTLGLIQKYSSSSTPLVETGAQTDRETYSTALGANHRFGDRVSLEMALNQTFMSAVGFSSSRQWSSLDWLGYQLLQNLNFAVGAGGGYVELDQQPSQVFGQLQGRMVWQATTKLDATLTAGFEDREILKAGSPGILNPLFGATVKYRPAPNTSISLTVNRTVNVSLLQNLISEASEVRVDFSQRFFEKLVLAVGGAYRGVSYVSTLPGLAAGRVDDYYNGNLRLTCPLLKRGSIAAVYQYTSNSSSTSAFALSGTQVGLELSYRY